MPIDLDNLFLIYCICAVHFNLSSIITPKNLVLLAINPENCFSPKIDIKLLPF